ncbi:MAG: imidazole glycerol phosphate synthase subunit HisH [bacterium]|nr:imidazole glycerol phosphate synthase subunit HisH [bacterium]
MSVAIIDYGMGNLASVKRAVEECGFQPFITDSPFLLSKASHLILPGVGSFDKAMENLNKLGLTEEISKQALKNKIPLLGICLGMQLLASKGYEGKETEGLGLIEGEVAKLDGCQANEPLPHVGWNNVDLEEREKQEPTLFKEIETSKDFYFVHSYHFIPDNESVVLAKTPYCLNGKGFVSVIQKDNIFAVQFHPEKSQKLGLQLLKNFLQE